jgi:hypothetical protein
VTALQGLQSLDVVVVLGRGDGFRHVHSMPASRAGAFWLSRFGLHSVFLAGPVWAVPSLTAKQISLSHSRSKNSLTHESLCPILSSSGEHQPDNITK